MTNACIHVVILKSLFIKTSFDMLLILLDLLIVFITDLFCLSGNNANNLRLPFTFDFSQAWFPYSHNCRRQPQVLMPAPWGHIVHAIISKSSYFQKFWRANKNSPCQEHRTVLPASLNCCGMRTLKKARARD